MSRCEKCLTENPDGMKFCGHCGESLESKPAKKSLLRAIMTNRTAGIFIFLAGLLMLEASIPIMASTVGRLLSHPTMLSWLPSTPLLLLTIFVVVSSLFALSGGVAAYRGNNYHSAARGGFLSTMGVLYMFLGVDEAGLSFALGLAGFILIANMEVAFKRRQRQIEEMADKAAAVPI